MSQKLTKAEMNGWWKHRANEFDLHKIRSVIEVSEPIDSRISRNIPYVVIGGHYAQTLPLTVFRGLYELVDIKVKSVIKVKAVIKDKLDEEVKKRILKVATPAKAWDELNVEETCQAVEFSKELWNVKVGELSHQEACYDQAMQ